jgi:hypothetical protein
VDAVVVVGFTPQSTFSRSGLVRSSDGYLRQSLISSLDIFGYQVQPMNDLSKMNNRREHRLDSLASRSRWCVRSHLAWLCWRGLGLACTSSLQSLHTLM